MLVLGIFKITACRDVQRSEWHATLRPSESNLPLHCPSQHPNLA